MTTAQARSIFTALSADEVDNQLTEMQSLCMNCYEQGQTRLLLTRIPYYKDVILSSFECDFCHFKNNDVQPAQRVEAYGILINAHITDGRDLNRQFVKSAYGTIRIKELDFEQAPHSENGLLTTIEGLLDSVIENINKTIKQIKETMEDVSKKRENSSATDDDEKSFVEFEQQKEKLDHFIARVESCKSLSTSFHFEIDDPSGNSFVENPNAPNRDEKLTIKNYRRTPEQNELLGMTEEEQHEESTVTKVIVTPEENQSKLDEPDSIHDEVLTFLTNCPNCEAPCDTNMKVTKIPYFKEIIVMATSCDICGQRSNEVKSGTGIAPQGIRYTLIMNDSTDLNRDILVSETSSFAIPDLDFELSSSRSIGGRFTTLEGIFTTLKTQLSTIIMPFSGGDSHDANTDQNRMSSFVKLISEILAGDKFVTVVLDDPAGNCYLQNNYAPDPDPQLIVEHYDRSEDQDEMLGLIDMKVEDYAES